ncbi:MAG: ankyrin repeat domain-containing protein [Methylophilaceae bacterium]|nr:ankyrin repeat domain-containing protein [Methylophilaceae bacterium]
MEQSATHTSPATSTTRDIEKKEITSKKFITIDTTSTNPIETEIAAIVQAILTPDTPDQEVNTLLGTLESLGKLVEQSEEEAAPNQQKEMDIRLGLTPLHKAVRDNNEQEARSLLEQGANPDEAALFFSFTPRQMAAEEPETPTSQLVLSWPQAPTAK